jgi:hypothetical protein
LEKNGLTIIAEEVRMTSPSAKTSFADFVVTHPITGNTEISVELKKNGVRPIIPLLALRGQEVRYNGISSSGIQYSAESLVGQAVKSPMRLFTYTTERSTSFSGSEHLEGSQIYFYR